MSMSEKYYEFLHEIKPDIQAILEYVKDIPEMKSDIKQMKSTLNNHEVDIDLLKIGIELHSKEIKKLQAHLPI